MSEESAGYKVVEAGKVFVCKSCSTVVLQEEEAKRHVELHVEESKSEAAYIEETKFLMGMKQEDRDGYAEKVVFAVVEGLKKVGETKGAINQKKMLDKFQREMGENMPEILTCIMYSVKPRFRRVYVELMRLVGGIDKQVKMP